MPKSFDELSRYMQIRAIVAYNWVKCVLKFSRVCSKGILCTLVFLLTLHIFKAQRSLYSRVALSAVLEIICSSQDFHISHDLEPKV